MRVTVILKDLTEQFYTGIEGMFQGFDQMSPKEKFEKCKKMHQEKRATMKIGSGQFRDAVDLNQMLRGAYEVAFSLEPRKGYRLAVFEFSKA